LRNLKLEEEVLKGGLDIPTSSTIIEGKKKGKRKSASASITRTNGQIADNPSQKDLWNKVQGKA
jgi:hypothetical protein